MPTKDNFPITTTIPFSEAGNEYTEVWLQDQICSNPSILTLGDLEFVTREKIQWKNGRLDILLKDENDRMFEVEVMLGETDEKHIIHTIEYWDNEKRKFPQRQHFPVLVAESFDRRFFNIIHLFSQTIPLIAVQVSIVEVAGVKSLHFSKIIDIYQEQEETDVSTFEEHDEAYWNEKASWSVEAAKKLVEIISDEFPNDKLHYVKNYIAIESNGEQRIWIKKRRGDKSQLRFWFSEKLRSQAVELLDKAEISYTPHYEMLYLTMDSKTLENNAVTIKELAKLSRLSWEE